MTNFFSSIFFWTSIYVIHKVIESVGIYLNAPISSISKVSFIFKHHCKTGLLRNTIELLNSVKTSLFVFLLAGRKLENLTNNFFIQAYCKEARVIRMFLSFRSKSKIIQSYAVPVKNALLVQELLTLLFRSKTVARKSSDETELESHCN